MENKVYIAIDLKSYYASVECVERGLDPLTTNLVVADETRTDKTICLAVTPSLKAYGISGRARLFEVIQDVEKINRERMGRNPLGYFIGKSSDTIVLQEDPTLELDYIVAMPQMALYQKVSAKIVNIYLNYVAPEDVHVYSIDEVFIDATHYLKAMGCTVHEFAMLMIKDVLKQTGITATAGIGTNMFLAKVAMDIVAKKMPADKDGVRIAELDEYSFREKLWDHRPITDIWHIASGSSRRLSKWGMYTLGDICRVSETDEELLYREFGINAEVLIDHAWGYDPVTIADIKAYRPKSRSVNMGQVLMRPYKHDEVRLVIREMADLLACDLVRKKLVTEKIVVWVGYDRTNASNPDIMAKYTGKMGHDWYGRTVPEGTNGSARLDRFTSSGEMIGDAVTAIFDAITDDVLLVRRLGICASEVISEEDLAQQPPEQIDLFTDYSEREIVDNTLEREHRRQQAVLAIREKFGKNSILMAMNLLPGATTVTRHQQIGGHRA